MLEIVIGGKAQGKLSYVLDKTGYKIEEICDEDSMILGEEITSCVINHFHLCIRKALQESYDLNQLVNDILAVKRDMYLICDEVGSGVVPVDAFERQYREQVGRVMCKLTRSAHKVVRIQCGIATIIKG